MVPDCNTAQSYFLRVLFVCYYVWIIGKDWRCNMYTQPLFILWGGEGTVTCGSVLLQWGASTWENTHSGSERWNSSPVFPVNHLDWADYHHQTRGTTSGFLAAVDQKHVLYFTFLDLDSFTIQTGSTQSRACRFLLGIETVVVARRCAHHRNKWISERTAWPSASYLQIWPHQWGC